MNVAFAPIEGTRQLKALRVERAPALPPSWVERAMVVVTTFVLLNKLPNTWFVTRSEHLADPSNAVATLTQLGLMGLAIIRLMGMLNPLVKLIRSEVFVFLFAGMTLLSVLWSADLAHTAKEGTIFVFATLYAAYLVIRFRLDEIIKLIAIMYVIGGLVNLGVVLATPQYGIQSNGLWSGVFAQKNGLGYLSALAIPTLWLAARLSRKVQILYFAGIVIHVILLLGSDSKTMLGAAVVSLASIFLLGTLRSRRTLRGGALVTIVMLASLTASLTLLKIKELTNWLDKDVTLTGRIPLWQSIAPVLDDRPWVGWGFEAAFGGYFSPTHDVWLDHPWQPSHSHNLVLQLWLEVGLIGLALYLAFFIRAVSRGVTVVGKFQTPAALWPMALLVFALLISITETGMYRQELGWVLIVVASLSIAINYDRNPAAEEESERQRLVGANFTPEPEFLDQPKSPSFIEDLPVLEAPDYSRFP